MTQKDENYVYEWETNFENIIYFPLDNFLLNLLQIQIIERVSGYLELDNIHNAIETFQGPIFLLLSRFLSGSLLFHDNRQIITQQNNQLNIQWIINQFDEQIELEIDNLISRGYMFTMAGRIALRTINGIRQQIQGLDGCILVLLDNIDGDKCNMQEKQEILCLLKLMIQNIYGVQQFNQKQNNYENLRKEILNTLQKYENIPEFQLNIKIIQQILNKITSQQTTTQQQPQQPTQQDQNIQEEMKQYQHLSLPHDQDCINYINQNSVPIYDSFLQQLNLQVENIQYIEYYKVKQFEKLYYIKYQDESELKRIFSTLQLIINQQPQQNQLQILTYLFENPKYISNTNISNITDILTPSIILISTPVLTKSLSYSVFNKYLPSLCQNSINNSTSIDLIIFLNNFIKTNKIELN